MEDADFAEQDNGDAASFALADLRSEVTKESLYLLPLDVGARRMSEDRCESPRMLPLHAVMVLQQGTTRKHGSFGSDGWTRWPAPKRWPVSRNTVGCAGEASRATDAPGR